MNKLSTPANCYNNWSIVFRLLVLFIFFELLTTNVFAQQTIITYAGSGEEGFSGDGGNALAAKMVTPVGVAVDKEGNLYIADAGNNRIRKVTIATHTITTIAGNGIRGYGGDGGLAINASLNQPTGVAVDAEGNVFIADWANHRVRKVNANGFISTVAGIGLPLYRGDGADAISAGLNSPRGVAVDQKGQIYIADAENNRIRKVATDGIITTIAGNGNKSFAGDGNKAIEAALNMPYSVAVNSKGAIYIADAGNNRVRKINTEGDIFTIAGDGQFDFKGDGGLATNASFVFPYGVGIDATDAVYIADWGNRRVRKMVGDSLMATIAGDGNAGASGDGGLAINAQLNAPYSIAVDSLGRIYIADADNNNIRRVADAILPIQIRSFAVAAVPLGAELTWQAVNQINAQAIDIQKSVGNNVFVTIGSLIVQPGCCANYAFVDSHAIATSSLFYRLQIRDFDGVIHYSNTLPFSALEATSTPSIYPNPASNSVTIVGKGIQQVAVTDARGVMVTTKTFGNAVNPVVLLRSLTKGVYYITVTNLLGKHRIRLMKE